LKSATATRSSRSTRNGPTAQVMVTGEVEK
jgi:hypothetical protein